jgi:hypothetical protein
MNTPLVLFERRLPRELINIIQSYLSNDIVYLAIRNYFHYLLSEQELYMQHMYETYVMEQCYCHKMSSRNMRVYDGCDHCNWYERIETDDEHFSSLYLTCITYNEQYYKIFHRKM